MYVVLVSRSPKFCPIWLHYQPFFSYMPLWHNYTEWHHNDLEHLGEVYLVYVLLVSRVKKNAICCMINDFRLTCHFMTCALNDSKMALDVPRATVHLKCTVQESQMSPGFTIWSTRTQTHTTYTKWPQNNINTNWTVPHHAHIFVTSVTKS